MKAIRGWFLSALVVCLSLCGSPASAENRPVTGKKATAFGPIDRAALEFMDKVGCQAATVAVSKDGRLLYSRGYGWSDQAKRKPVQPDALMRIASVTKPITAAAVKSAVHAKLLSLDAKAFELIAIKPPGGKVVDARIYKITVGHLLEHKGGWDGASSFDPMFRATQIENELRLGHPTTPVDVIAYMLTKPLQFAPGEKTAYSNFGYCVLGRVLEKVYKKPYSDCIQQVITKPLGIKDIKLGHAALNKRDTREAWYPVGESAFPFDVMDSHGGLIASAPALCQFLRSYWISGDPRLKGQRAQYTFFGNIPGTTAMVRQREDGVNLAILFNGRRDAHFAEDNDALKDAIDKALDKAGK